MIGFEGWRRWVGNVYFLAFSALYYFRIGIIFLSGKLLLIIYCAVGPVTNIMIHSVFADRNVIFCCRNVKLRKFTGKELVFLK